MKSFRKNTLYVLAILALFSSSSSLNWVKPDEFAQDCIDTLNNDYLIQWCRTGALLDYDPIRLQTNYTTVWETCCQAFDEMQCFEQQGREFCPNETFAHYLKYIQESRHFFSQTFCKNPHYISGWQIYCQTLSYDAIHHNQSGHELELFLHEPDDAQTKNCLDTIQNRTDDGDRIEFCRRETKKDLPKKYDDNINYEIFCCAQYNFMECIAKQADNYCHQSERSSISEWSRHTFKWASDKFCHRLPYYDHDDENHLDSKTDNTCRRYNYNLQDNFIGTDSKQSSSKWWLFIPITLIIGIIFGAIYHFKFKSHR
ncbi:hypothetical protein BLA29_000442 [Euroglyphus maynei]|uniref:Uncharacterized protein n=1 Tax=Euroglyphus maynei TaxID=6958 RepID=A0A1Y3BLH0_EURMA|nr:hypothetical protein BLA29_000442 [Euroglyphus maynei]